MRSLAQLIKLENIKEMDEFLPNVSKTTKNSSRCQKKSKKISDKFGNLHSKKENKIVIKSIPFKMSRAKWIHSKILQSFQWKSTDDTSETTQETK